LSGRSLQAKTEVQRMKMGLGIKGYWCKLSVVLAGLA